MIFNLDKATIKKHLDMLAKSDVRIKSALDKVGYPDERRKDGGFDSFMRVIVGQQLSVKAAATIYGRLETLLNGDVCPENFLRHNDESLRSVGLSRQKITYGRSLCSSVTDGSLPLDALPKMADEEAIDAIITVKGLGRWSAEMYLMFVLGRTDIWPVDDLAVRGGIARIVGYNDKPTPKVVKQWGEQWRPYRSSVALLSWKYYSDAPL